MKQSTTSNIQMWDVFSIGLTILIFVPDSIESICSKMKPIKEFRLPFLSRSSMTKETYFGLTLIDLVLPLIKKCEHLNERHASCFNYSALLFPLLEKSPLVKQSTIFVEISLIISVGILFK